MLKKLLIFIVFISLNINAQCAMCKAVIEGGNEAVAEGVNNGITYLMVFPYLLIGLLLFFLYRHRKKTNS
ncbi:hypothetical protein [uncultured Tenacibaculum sp.]|uniref:hypothetical protein n=1 Tax=uncultured Tenacibaculum sp. TaxID=174713 RepID=UPI00260CD607|nr:hypothetical protein [uncultured Tenacibaculum sp.]